MSTAGVKATDRSHGIQVISRAADILRLLGTETGGLSLGQIADRVNLPRSTVQRIVGALAAEGFISVMQRDGGITLGPEIQNLARATALETRERFRPIMHAIREATGETVDLAVLEGDRMRFLDQFVGSQRLRTVSSIGETFPLTNTANGKASLACLPAATAETLIAGELKQVNDGKRVRNRLMKELNAIRNGALARDEDEHTEGVSALGFGIMDVSGDVYALSTPVPSSRYKRVKALLETVLLEQRDKMMDAELHLAKTS